MCKHKMDKKVHVKDFVMTIDNMVSPQICDFIVDKMTTTQNNYKQQYTIDNRVGRQDIQRDGLLFIQYLSYLQVQENIDFGTGESINNIFPKILKEGCDVYTNTMKEGLAKYVHQNILEYSDFKFQETLKSGGFHDWHFENIGYAQNSRFLVWSIFLNDVKEGGETEFLYNSMRIKPKRGSMVLFPPYYTHTHRGNPPISNNKYIATGWFYLYSGQ